MLHDNMLVGDPDWEVTRKTNKLKDELKANSNSARYDVSY
jgi:hypothetical protein